MECPCCHRRLLSHASANCNWCGAEISDADYQAKAQVEREAYFAQQALHDAQSLALIESISVNTSDPYFTPLSSSPTPRYRRPGTRIQPPTYNNQPQPLRSEGQSTDVNPSHGDSRQEQSSEADQPETGHQGRFQHLEL